MNSFDGVITKSSVHSVSQTLDNLEAFLHAKGVKVFARIDQQAEAKAVGLTMPPAELLIFGDPRGGTPIMLAAPEAALDLPLKVLAWQDATGRVWLSYNDPEYLKRRFALGDALIQPISGIGGLVDKAAA